MSRNQHQQANNHPKRSTRGERWLAKLGVRYRVVGLKRLAREVVGRKGRGGE